MGESFPLRFASLQPVDVVIELATLQEPSTKQIVEAGFRIPFFRTRSQRIKEQAVRDLFAPAGIEEGGHDADSSQMTERRRPTCLHAEKTSANRSTEDVVFGGGDGMPSSASSPPNQAGNTPSIKRTSEPHASASPAIPGFGDSPV
jgi:hypothetical protein